MKVLFILKKRQIPFVSESNPKYNDPGLSTGLYNSAKFMCDMLNDMSIESKMVVLIDNNAIDREVTLYKPTHVIVEALWVVPTKFTILVKLHPKVKWIIRLHSEMPFLAGEGMAMDWIGDYLSFPTISISFNAPRLLNDIKHFIKIKKNWNKEEIENRLFYLPNFYPQIYLQKEDISEKDTLEIGCFGAIRPLKNHMNQALAAIRFADSLGKKLNFHINTGRLEMKGDSVYHNLKALFNHLAGTGHELIDHDWTPREDFLKLCRQMDIGMQVSFSETFNIVGADFVSQGVPIVLTSEIPWSIGAWSAKPTETDEMYEELHRCYKSAQETVLAYQISLKEYTDITREVWRKRFTDTR